MSWLSAAVTGDWVVLALVLVGLAVELYFVVLRRQAALWSAELHGWSLAYAGYLLLATYSNSGFLRHLLQAIVPWPFPEAGAQVTTRGGRVALGAVVAPVGVTMQYFWIRWFWVPSANRISVP
jgi:hypothetical protein